MLRRSPRSANRVENGPTPGPYCPASQSWGPGRTDVTLIGLGSHTRARVDRCLFQQSFSTETALLSTDVGYVDRLDRLKLYPWSLEAVRLLRRAGYAVVVVTNQAGVARGMVEEPVVVEAFDWIQARLAEVGERLDGHYYCPHLPDAPLEVYRRDCACHKPKPGMVIQAADDLDLDLSRSVVVGDRWTDVQLGRAVGAKAALVETGYGVTQVADPPDGVSADGTFSHLLDAVGWVLRL